MYVPGKVRHEWLTVSWPRSVWVTVEHDPEVVARELATKLSSRARHVCVLLGAGASVSAGLPTIADLTAIVLAALPDAERAQFSAQLAGRNLEEALSRLRRIRSLVVDGGTFEGLTEASAADLDRQVCEAISKAVDITGKPMDSFERLASWAGRMESQRPIELFTVNYDLLIEAGLEEVGVPYFDGFIGAIRGRFTPDLVEPTPGRSSRELPPGFVRLWKLHGSVNWSETSVGGRNEIVRVGSAVGHAAAIYPSDEKYEESRRVPFVALMDRFRRALVEPETITLVAGYSFGDEHLNEMIFDAAQRHPRSEVVAFCFAAIDPLIEARANGTRNLVVLSPDEAIIDGQKGAWSSVGDVPDVFVGDKWLLGDFSNLSAYLARQVGPDALP